MSVVIFCHLFYKPKKAILKGLFFKNFYLFIFYYNYYLHDIYYLMNRSDVTLFFQNMYRNYKNHLKSILALKFLMENLLVVIFIATMNQYECSLLLYFQNEKIQKDCCLKVINCIFIINNYLLEWLRYE